MSFQGIDRGSLLVVISDQFVTRAEEGGVRQYAPSPGESVPCTVSADDDFLVARLAADLSNAERVDLSRTIPGPGEWKL